MAIGFKDQSVVVTGAGRGLGRLFALELARRGAGVVVNDLGGSMHGEGSDDSVAMQVVREIQDAGGAAVASHDSVADQGGAAAIVRTAVEHFGRLDAIVSNAGIFGTVPFEDISAEEWRRMMSVHVDGGFYLTQESFRVMKEQGYGRIVLVASSAGAFGQRLSAHYAAAKSALIGLSNTVAIEGAPYGIACNTLLPFGFSRMVSETVADPAMLEMLKNAIRPELVVPMAVFLASRECGLTHRNLTAGGGGYSRAFMGLSDGWFAGLGAQPSADDVATHIEEVTATGDFIVPEAIDDEMSKIFGRLAQGAAQ
jgi:NAD(P)-dependent dehydrogenase (short-subunit alcohol dehydrogenase family)